MKLQNILSEHRLDVGDEVMSRSVECNPGPDTVALDPDDYLEEVGEPMDSTSCVVPPNVWIVLALD